MWLCVPDSLEYTALKGTVRPPLVKSAKTDVSAAAYGSFVLHRSLARTFVINGEVEPVIPGIWMKRTSRSVAVGGTYIER